MDAEEQVELTAIDTEVGSARDAETTPSPTNTARRDDNGGFYLLLCRARFTYVFIMQMLVGLTISVRIMIDSILIEGFVFGNMSHAVQALTLFFFPFLCFLGAVLLARHKELIVDSWHHTCLPLYRCKLAKALDDVVRYFYKDLDNNFCLRVVEAVLFFVIEILPICLAVFVQRTDTSTFIVTLNYLEYAFYCVVPHAFVWQAMLFWKRDILVVYNIWLACKSGRLTRKAAADQGSVKHLWESVDDENIEYFGPDEIFPDLDTTHRIFNTTLTSINTTLHCTQIKEAVCCYKSDPNVKRGNLAEFWFENRREAILVILLGLFATIMALASFSNKGYAFLFCASLWPILTAIIYFKHHFKALKTILGLYLFFLVLTCFIYGLGQVNIAGAQGCTNYGRANDIYDANEPMYQSCGMKKKGLDIIDYGLFASIAYKDNTTELFQNLTTDWFPEWELKHSTDEDSLLQFHQFDHTQSNVTVIAIRGTFGTWTALFDINFYFGSFVYEYMNMILPLSSLTPEAWSRFLVGASDVGTNDLKLVESIVSHAETIGPERQIVFTGHSLGGGMAKIASLSMFGSRETNAVSFSGPGAVYVETRFNKGGSRDALDRIAWNIVPRNDVVPMADKQGGLVQVVDCQLFAVDCHFLKNTMVTLVKSCGDSKNRDLCL